MREITKKVYAFNELSDDAQENANYLYNQDCSDIDEDFSQFFRAFKDTFPYGEYYFSAGYRATYGGMDHAYYDYAWMEEEMSPIRISKWFNNRYPELRGIESLTGTYTDSCMENVLMDVYRYDHSYRCIKDIFDDILHETAWFCEEERNYRCSVEYYAMMCEDCGLEFYEDGTMA